MQIVEGDMQAPDIRRAEPRLAPGRKMNTRRVPLSRPYNFCGSIGGLVIAYEHVKVDWRGNGLREQGIEQQADILSLVIGRQYDDHPHGGSTVSGEIELH